MNWLVTFRHEMRQLLYAPLIYIFQIAFLTALSLCIFLVADFYASDDASPRLLLAFLPWVALILVPAICARAWVDEPGDRSLELISTLPVSTAGLVMGKFLAAGFVMLVTLAFTVPFVVSLFWLGQPDAGLLIASYVGAAALLAVYVAIALCMASMMRDQVSALVLGMAMLFILLVLGWDVFRQFVSAFDRPGISELLVAMSPKTWLDSMGTGVIRFQAVVAFAAVTGAALFVTGWMLTARKAGPVRIARRLAAVGILIASIAAAAFVVGRPGADWYLDLTDEQEYTLAPGTVEILRRLPQTNVTVYWSASQTDVPVAVRAHARRVSDLLELLASRTGGSLTVSRVDPVPDTDAELQALGHGIQRVPMTSGDFFYLGAVFEYGDRVGRIPYFDNRRERLLEYDLMVALHSLAKNRVPKVGVLSPLVAPRAVEDDPPGLSFLTDLRKAYDVAVVPYFKDRLPDGLDVLVVIGAAILRRDMLYSIDQFVMRGGGLIVLLDPFVRLQRASNQMAIRPSQSVDDISDLLLAYGLRYVDGVVGDPSLGAPVSHATSGTLSYPFWLRVGGAQLSDSHPVTASLHELLFAEAGEFVLDMDDPEARVLVTTSEGSGVLARDRFGESTPVELAAEFVPDPRRRVIAAAAGGGALPSAYAAAPRATHTDHRARSGTAGVVFAVADVDWIYDTFALQVIDVDDQRMVRPLNDNYSFLLNMIEYASGDPALVSIRSRGRLHRTFTLVEERFRRAEQRHQAKRNELTTSISRIESRIARLLEGAGVDNVARLPAADRERVLEMQRELLPVRRELREVRREIRRDVEALGRTVTAFNMLASPVLVLLFAGYVFARRRRTRAQDLAGFAADSKCEPS